jgi:hypothetical protein
MKVIALDPGGTTGWAVFRDGHFYRAGELEGQHHRQLHQLLYKETVGSDDEAPYYLIFERFDHRNNEFAKLISVEYIGVIKLFLQQYPHVHGVPQGSSIKTFADEKKLSATKWYIEYKKPHARDAARHLLYWLVEGTHMHDDYRDAVLQQFKTNMR